MREGRIERDGASIAYEVWEAKRPGAGPLVFLPGWACSRAAWRDTARRIDGARTCVLIDLAGAGDSPIHGRSLHTLKNLAQDVLAVMAAEGVEHAVLVGHSMGGAVALEAAILSPKVDAVIAVDSLIHPDIYDAAEDAMVDGALGALAQDFPGAVRGSMENYIHPGPGEVAARAQVEAMAAATPDQVLPVMADFMRWDVASALDRTNVPVAIIGASRLQPEGRSPAWASRVQLFWVDDVGHFIMLEDPKAFDARLKETLTALHK